jgi:ferritin-like metal-binding protein YciE
MPEQLRDYLHDCIREIYYIEQSLIDQLPELSAQVQNPELKKAMDKHLQETQDQAERLVQIAQTLNIELDMLPVDSFDSLIDETMMNLETYDQIGDHLIIGAAILVEHTEMAHYKKAIELAKAAGYNDAARILDTSLVEEKHTAAELESMLPRLLKPA